jgi:branched-subunit amino acid aminotransferase/4-amino-4-deoxychorismate lyase
VLCRGERAFYHVGGGVVWDSEPEAEFQETLDKGWAMRAALVGPPTMATPTFSRYAIRGDELVEAAELRVSPLGDGFMYAHGLFETIRALAGVPVFLDHHVARLQLGARAVALELPTNLDEWRDRLARLARANQLGDGSFKLVRYRDVGGVAEFAVSRATSYPPEVYARGFRVRTAPMARAGALQGVKSLAHLENLLAKRAAQAEGFDEVIFADPSGNLLEGAGTNLFVVVDGQVITAPLGDILPGVARGVVLQLCGAQAVERRLTPELVAAAEEIFVTNAILGVMPVAELDQCRFDLRVNALTRAVAAKFAALQLGSVREG